jgi:integrase
MAKSHRRGQNEGSIFQRKSDGRWCAMLSLGWQEGRRVRKNLYASTAEEVRQAMTKALRERDLGMLPQTSASPSMERFLEQWLTSRSSSLRVRSREAYAAIIRNHLAPAIGRVRLEKLTPGHVQAILDAKLAAGLSARSVRSIRIVLVAALKQAVRWGMIGRNVAELVSGPKAVNAEMKVLSPDQARQFLVACRGDSLEALYWLALSTGLRRGELLALKWQDLDLERGILSVRRALGRSSSQGIVIAEPKTPQGRRTVRLSAPVIAALRAHRKAQLERRLQAGREWQEADYLFTTGIGTTIDPGNIGKAFKALLVRAQLPIVRFHDLRHSAATIALSQGVHPKIVSEMLGHSKISLTLDVYSHSLPTLQVEAADRIASALTGTAS